MKLKFIPGGIAITDEDSDNTDSFDDNTDSFGVSIKEEAINSVIEFISVLKRLRKNGLKYINLIDAYNEKLNFKGLGIGQPDYCLTFELDLNDEDVKKDLELLVEDLNIIFRGGE